MPAKRLGFGRNVSPAPAGIIAFAFGSPHTTLANKRIAEIAFAEARSLGARVLTQRDIDIKGVSVTRVPESENDPPPTLRIARVAVRWALGKGIGELRIVAATPHLDRCARDLAFAIQEFHAPVTITISEAMGAYPLEGWFCEESTQLRARSKVLWGVRDGILSLMPEELYARIAS